VTKNLTMTPARVKEIMEKAERWDEHEARLQAGGGRRGALADRVAREVRREYFPGGGGGGAQMSGLLGELSPSQRAFAAHVLLAVDSDPNFRKVHPKGLPVAAQIRGSLQASGVRFNTGETTGIGAELVEVCPQEDIWDAAMCQSELIERLGGFRPIRGKSQKVINMTGLPEAYVTPPAEDCTELDCRTTSPIGTHTHEYPAAKITVDVCMPVELDEDSALDVVEQYSEIGERAIRRATENAVIRGDATLSGTHNINNEGATITLTATGQAPAYTAFDGIAHATLINNSANDGTAAGYHAAGDPIAADEIMKTRLLMDDPNSGSHWGFCDASELLYIADAIAYGGMIQMEDVKWVDRVGAMATILTGQLPTLHGVPIYMSPAVRPTNDAGLIDAVTPGNNTFGQLHIVNRGGVRVGRHRDLEIIVEVNKKCDLITITFQWRLSLGRRSSQATAAGIEAIASIYGIAA